jgi:citrate lyase beta subunit
MDSSTVIYPLNGWLFSLCMAIGFLGKVYLTPAQIEAIRAALIEGEQSGFTDRSVDEIWEDARRRG